MKTHDRAVGDDAEPVGCMTHVEVGVEGHFGVAETSHDRVVGGPVTDAGQGNQSLHEIFSIGAGVEPRLKGAGL